MALQIYNTLTREKAPFVPKVPGKAGIYVCGITVYDLCHVGHARSAIAFDIVHRWLKESGYQVTFVKNFTDVDDKIIKRANERGVDSNAISQQYIDAYHEDFGRLGLLAPTVEPKATEHIAEMIEVIELLLKKGIAYETKGDVWYSVSAYPKYGRLARRNLDEMRSGASGRTDTEEDKEKRDKFDFALWKRSKPGEPEWDSPWGKGRPGWHIECSGMSKKYLGQPFDIHGGGEDLVFPHHENEIAQSEAAYGEELAHVWMHNGFLRIDAEKMSKSLGNFLTIRDVLARFPAEAFRLFVLGAHYRHPLDFTHTAIAEASDGLERLYRSLDEANKALRTHLDYTVRMGDAEGREADEAKALLAAMNERFVQAMDDDFNTALATSVLFEAARALNRLTAKERMNTGEQDLVNALRNELKRLAGILGLLSEDPATWLAGNRTAGVESSGLTPEAIDAKIAERAAAKKAKDYKRADEVRAWLKEKGIVLEDGPNGTTWRMG